MKKVHNLSNTRRALLVLFMFAAAGSVSAAWTNAPGVPPNKNTPAPINTSATAQVKNGNLSVNSFVTFGKMLISFWRPEIKFVDPTNGGYDWWIYTDNNKMHFVIDDGYRPASWAGTSSAGDGVYDWPAPLTLSGPSATFRSQVRAEKYCNRSGGNCFSPSDVASASASKPVFFNADTYSGTYIGSLTYAYGYKFCALAKNKLKKTGTGTNYGASCTVVMSSTNNSIWSLRAQRFATNGNASCQMVCLRK